MWHAIATGPGISSWFAPTDVEEREGGAIAFRMGPGMESSGVVTRWDPPHRFAYEERDWSQDAPPLGTEFIIEARSGGTCTVRLVNSLFADSAEWDDQMEPSRGATRSTRRSPSIFSGPVRHWLSRERNRAGRPGSNRSSDNRFTNHLRFAVDVFNLLDSNDSDIEYFYRSRLPGEPPAGVDDIHFHPTLKRTVRVSLTVGT